MWYEVAKGSHIYEFGDHGGLIVMANDHVATTKVFQILISWHVRGWSALRLVGGVRSIGFREDFGFYYLLTCHRPPVCQILFTFNEGESWHEYEFTKEPVQVDNIIIEPTSTRYYKHAGGTVHCPSFVA